MKYSREWFVNGISDNQKKIIENIKSNAELLKDKKAKIDIKTLQGNFDEVKTKLNNLVSMKGHKEEAEFIGTLDIDELLTLIDTDGDLNISAEEISNIASLDMEVFSEKTVKFSADDLLKLVDNKDNASDAIVTKIDDNTTLYKYNDGLITNVVKDSDDNVVLKTERFKNEDGTITTISYDYKTSAKTKIITNEKGDVLSKNVNKIGEIEDEDYTITHDDKGSKKVKLSTVGKEVVSIYDKGGKKITNSVVNVKYNQRAKNIGKTEQQEIGECWLLSGINALNSTTAGRKIIKDSVKYNYDGSATVYLKGVDKTYTYSAEQIIKQGYTTNKNFAKGDDENFLMRLFELAISDYRKEQIENGKKFSAKATEDDPLAGGYDNEVFYYLTGKKVPEVKNINLISKYLDNKQKDIKNFALTCSFKDVDDDNCPKGTIMQKHLYSIASVDNQYVYIVNPHDSSKTIAYKKEAFMKNVNDMSQLKF